MSSPKNSQSAPQLPDQTCTYEQLQWYLRHKHSLPHQEKEKYKYLIDNFKECWEIWNRVRWDAAMASGGMVEVKKYYGKKFKPYYDSSWDLAKRWNEAQPKTKEEIDEFYKHADEYVYNLMVWFKSGDRTDFRGTIDRLISDHNIKSVIDYGCGVGNDGLYFISKEVKTYFIDYDCPASTFLKWRLKQRDIPSCFLSVDDIEMFPEADMFWAIDVLEHMIDPLEVVRKISPRCKIFAHRSKFNDNAGGRHPCHLSFEQQKLSEALRAAGFLHDSGDGLSVWVRDV